MTLLLTCVHLSPAEVSLADQQQCSRSNQNASAHIPSLRLDNHLAPISIIPAMTPNKITTSPEMPHVIKIKTFYQQTSRLKGHISILNLHHTLTESNQASIPLFSLEQIYGAFDPWPNPSANRLCDSHHIDPVREAKFHPD